MPRVACEAPDAKTLGLIEVPVPTGHKKAQDRLPFGARRPCPHRIVALCYRPQTQLSGRQTMRMLHLDTKQAELVRILFSIGLTAFVGLGTFIVIQHVTVLYE